MTSIMGAWLYPQVLAIAFLLLAATASLAQPSISENGDPNDQKGNNALAGAPGPAANETPLASGGWRLATGVGAKAELIDDPSRPGVLQVRIVNVGGQPEQIRLYWDGLKVTGNTPSEIRLRARAQWNRPIVARLVESRSEGKALSPDQSIALEPDWRHFTIKLAPQPTEGSARLCFDVGDRPGSIEISDVAIVGTSLVATGGQVTGNPNPTPPVANGTHAEDPSAESTKKTDSASPPDFRIDAHEGAAAKGEVDQKGRLVLSIPKGGTKSWHVQVSFPGFSIEKGKTYTLSARITSPTERPAAIAVSLDGPPWTSLGLYQELSLTPESKDIQLKFKAPADGKAARVNLDLGRSDVTAVIDRLAIRGEGGESVSLWPPKANAAPAKSNGPPEKKATPVDEPPAIAKDAQKPTPRPMPPAESQATAKPSWDLVQSGGAKARLQSPTPTNVGIRVDVETPGTELWNVQVNRRGLTVKSGAKGKVLFRAKGDAERPVAVAFSLGNAPWTNLGLYQLVTLETEWREFSFDFTVKDDSNAARLHFDVGGAAAGVDIDGVKLSFDGAEIDLAANPSSNVDPASPPIAQPEAPSTWDFQVQGVPARCAVVSSDPWHVRVTVGGAGAAEAVRVLRSWPKDDAMRIRATAGAKVACRLMANDKEIANAVLTTTGDWQPVGLKSDGASAMAVFDLGGQGGPVEIAEGAVAKQ